MLWKVACMMRAELRELIYCTLVPQHSMSVVGLTSGQRLTQG
jgi:hypothetical protein